MVAHKVGLIEGKDIINEAVNYIPVFLRLATNISDIDLIGLDNHIAEFVTSPVNLYSALSNIRPIKLVVFSEKEFEDTE